MTLFTSHTQALGLDLSDLVLRAVQFSGQGRGLGVAAFSQSALTPGVIVRGELLEPKSLSEAMKAILSRPTYGHFTGKHVVACLPDSRSFVKVIEVPHVDDSHLPETIAWELGQHLPLPMDELYIDWHVISASGSNTLRVATSAVPKALVDAYTSALEEAGLRPIGLIVEPIAIAFSLFSEAEQQAANILIVDLGHTRTGLIVCDHGVVSLTLTLPDIAGQRMTADIAQALHLTESEAEEAKVLCGLDPHRGRAALPTILAPVVDRLIAGIQQVLGYYAGRAQAHPITRLLLVGGGAHMRNLVPTLAQRLDLEVAIGNPLGQIGHMKHREHLQTGYEYSYATVIGLGLIAQSAKFRSET